MKNDLHGSVTGVTRVILGNRVIPNRKRLTSKGIALLPYYRSAILGQAKRKRSGRELEENWTLQSANARMSQATVESREEHQHKSMQVKW